MRCINYEIKDENPFSIENVFIKVKHLFYEWE